MAVAAGTAAVLALALLLYLTFGEYTRKVHVTGSIVPSAGVIRAVASQYGMVVARPVRDGDIVAQGQVLYELSSERTNGSGGIDARIDHSLIERRSLLAEERELQTAQLQQREKEIDQRQRLIEAELGRLDQEIALQAKRVQRAEAMVARYRVLKQQGFVSDMQLNQIENDASDQMARLHNLERTQLTAKVELAQARAEQSQNSAALRLNAVQSSRTLAALAQEEAEHQARNRIQVLAPVAGTVTALTAEQGQSVQAGTPLATVIPLASTLEAHLLAPSSAVGFIEAGQTVQLRLSAFPYQKFGQVEGTVIRVEPSPIGEANTGTASAEPVYRIAVKLGRQSINVYGREQYYKAGMTLDAEIRQDRRRLIEWVIDPVISATKGGAG
jgi:membrane fusion protein